MKLLKTEISREQSEEQRDSELQRICEYRQITREIRKALHALRPGEKGEGVCPFCGGIVDLERPYETYWKMNCRQGDLWEEAWGW